MSDVEELPVSSEVEEAPVASEAEEVPVASEADKALIEEAPVVEAPVEEENSLIDNQEE